MIKRKNFIILGSTGRNTGKTEFACRLIERFAPERKVYGVKVVSIDPAEGNCPRGGKGCGICTSLKGDYEIMEEKELDPTKDTSRMLISGAYKSYFLKVNIHSLEKGLRALLKLIPDDALAVCESNSIRKVIEPGLFLVIKNLHERRVKESCAEVFDFADKVVEFHNMSWDLDPERIQVVGNEWVLREKATAIILAGGRSSRMGGQDKSMLPIGGEPMISHIVRQLKPRFEQLIIGANDKARYSFLNLPVVSDHETGRGPLMGIYSCLMASDNEINFITACDIPEMNAGLIHRMIRLSSEADIVMPVTPDGKYEPLFAVYHKDAARAAARILIDQGSRIIELTKHLKTRFVPFEEGDWYRNLNIKDDYLKYINTRSRIRNCIREYRENDAGCNI